MTFSETLDASSVRADTFRLYSGASEVTATRATAGSSASFVLDEDLDWLANYTAVVTTGVRSYGGRTLREAATFSFTTADLSWSTPVMVSSSASGVAGGWSAAIVHPSGEIWAAYREGASGNMDLLVRRFSFRTGWSAPVLLENRSESVEIADLAVDGAGRVIAVWIQSDGSATSVWGSRWDGSTWSGPVLLETGAGAASSPALVADSAGHAVAVWVQDKSAGSIRDLWANRYDPTTGWGTAQLLESSDAGSVNTFSLGGSPSGSAIAVWSQSDGSVVDAFAATYVPGSGWTSPEPIETSPNNVSATVRVDVTGRALACWQQDGYDYWCNRYDGTVWNGPQRIIQDAYLPAIGMSRSGLAAILYLSIDYPKIARVRSFDPVSGWSAPVIVDTSNEQGYDTAIAINDRANVIATYTFQDATEYDAFATRFVPGRGWSAPARIEQLASPAFGAPVKLREDGRAIVTWSQDFAGDPRAWSATLR